MKPASRGSLPLMIVSSPLKSVEEENASVITLSSSTITSILKCPSILVIGSTTIFFDMLIPYLLLFVFDRFRKERMRDNTNSGCAQQSRAYFIRYFISP